MGSHRAWLCIGRWPQVFLGIAFNGGALLIWTAQTGSLAWAAVVLYAAGISWTLFYDTIYAHQDTEDVLMGLAVVLAAIERSVPSLMIALCGPWAMGWHLVWQLSRFDAEDNDKLLYLFQSNRNAGLIPLPFFAVAYFL